MEYVWIFGAMMVAAVIYGIVQATQTKEKARELGATETISMGQYLAGMGGAPRTTEGASCAITDAEFVFLHGFGAELGRIPRDSINGIILDDKSQITQRLTVTRIATLGVFSLAAPKSRTHEQYCLAIDWDDESGARQNAVFEFSDMAAKNLAHNAANRLQAAVFPKKQRIRADERKCPYCAEIIKAEANKCRYCHSDL